MLLGRKGETSYSHRRRRRFLGADLLGSSRIRRIQCEAIAVSRFLLGRSPPYVPPMADSRILTIGIYTRHPVPERSFVWKRGLRSIWGTEVVVAQIITVWTGTQRGFL